MSPTVISVTRLNFLCYGIANYNFEHVNFEVEYFLNGETEGVLTDVVIYFYDRQAPNFAISTQT